MNFLLVLLSFLQCNDCIYYRKPSVNIYKKNEIGFCMYHKDYAMLSRHNEKKCGHNATHFNPMFCKLKSVKNYINP